MWLCLLLIIPFYLQFNTHTRHFAGTFDVINDEEDDDYVPASPLYQVSSYSDLLLVTF